MMLSTSKQNETKNTTGGICNTCPTAQRIVGKALKIARQYLECRALVHAVCSEQSSPCLVSCCRHWTGALWWCHWRSCQSSPTLRHSCPSSVSQCWRCRCWREARGTSQLAFPNPVTFQLTKPVWIYLYEYVWPVSMYRIIQFLPRIQDSHIFKRKVSVLIKGEVPVR